MSSEIDDRIKVIDEWIDLHETAIRDLKNEKRKLIVAKIRSAHREELKRRNNNE